MSIGKDSMVEEILGNFRSHAKLCYLSGYELKIQVSSLCPKIGFDLIENQNVLTIFMVKFHSVNFLKILVWYEIECFPSTCLSRMVTSLSNLGARPHFYVRYASAIMLLLLVGHLHLIDVWLGEDWWTNNAIKIHV